MPHAGAPSALNRLLMSSTLLPLESSLAERLSQLSRALPGCCKVAGFSLEPHALSLFWPRCRLSLLCWWSGFGLFCSADLLFYRRALPLHVELGLGNDPCIVFPVVRPKVLPSTRCTPESLCRSIQEPLLPNLTSALLIVSFPTLRRRLLTSLCTNGV